MQVRIDDKEGKDDFEEQEVKSNQCHKQTKDVGLVISFSIFRLCTFEENENFHLISEDIKTFFHWNAHSRPRRSHSTSIILQEQKNSTVRRVNAFISFTKMS